MARRLECRTVGQEDRVSTVSKLSQFVHLTLPISFGRDTKSGWPLLPGVRVHSRGSKIAHAGKGVASRRRYPKPINI